MKKLSYRDRFNQVKNNAPLVDSKLDPMYAEKLLKPKGNSKSYSSLTELKGRVVEWNILILVKL